MTGGGVASRWAVAVAIAAGFAGQARAAPAGPEAGELPASTSEADMLRWLAAHTSVSRGLILMIEPRAAVALSARPSPVAGTVARIDLREELTSPDAKVRSARFLVDLDCSSQRYRIVERRMFALPNLEGEPQTDLQARPWTPVLEASPVSRAWEAACTTGFVYPYASLAAADVSPPPPRIPPPAIRKVAEPPAAPAPAPAPAPTPSRASASAPVPAPAARPGAYLALLGSYSVKANAVAASARLDRELARQMAGRRKTLSPVTVKGASYTVLAVSGFAGASEAAAFCKAARGIGLECLVRRKG